MATQVRVTGRWSITLSKKYVSSISFFLCEISASGLMELDEFVGTSMDNEKLGSHCTSSSNGRSKWPSWSVEFGVLALQLLILCFSTRFDLINGKYMHLIAQHILNDTMQPKLGRGQLPRPSRPLCLCTSNDLDTGRYDAVRCRNNRVRNLMQSFDW